MAQIVETREVREVDSAYSNPVVRLISAVIGLIDSLLLVRLLLRLLGANPLNGFVNFIYSLSEPLVRPFFGMFNTSVTALLSQAHLEVETVVAIAVYSLIAGVLMALAGALTSRG